MSGGLVIVGMDTGPGESSGAVTVKCAGRYHVVDCGPGIALAEAVGSVVVRSPRGTWMIDNDGSVHDLVERPRTA